MAKHRASAPGQSAHLVVHDAIYRVVVVKNPEPAHAHDAVHALCIEQSLVGRGRNVAEALADLAETVSELVSAEYLESLPEYQPNPDPALLNAFERKSATFEGCAVLRRGTLRMRLERVPVKSSGKGGKTPALRAEEISFLPLVA